ncbi:hypothetical protein ACMU_11470 [Actibacterium mucosum KCTC 23349]|uniref:Copper resistance protein D domain-containing protein n=1 Tax=Actibacterium mucosum KCTC 23349 TaxID=1454373 RepID=A0A037ZFQ2_9RHOB|nr:hypothetical protein [Actibacterium mucosum]KAJ55310.1 hypothetical protein ACMU_11470 [Actibacterium mucosum KCTC 23349]
MLLAVHFLHIAAGVFWAGGALFLALVLYPSIAAGSGMVAANVLARISRVSGLALGSAGGLTMLLGLARAWTSGAIAGFGDILSTYGVLVIVAFLMAGILDSRIKAARKDLEALSQNCDAFQAKAPARARRFAIEAPVLITAILVIMVVLGMGAY